MPFIPSTPSLPSPEHFWHLASVLRTFYVNVFPEVRAHLNSSSVSASKHENIRLVSVQYKLRLRIWHMCKISPTTGRHFCTPPPRRSQRPQNGPRTHFFRGNSLRTESSCDYNRVKNYIVMILPVVLYGHLKLGLPLWRKVVDLGWRIFVSKNRSNGRIDTVT
jgi:hypothetical protein